MTQRGPMLVGSRPIVTSDSEGPIRGTMIMGRFLEAKAIQRVSKRAKVDLRIWPVAGTTVPGSIRAHLERITKQAPHYMQETGRETLNIYATYPDVSGNPVLLLQSAIRRDVLALGLRVHRHAIVLAMSAGLVLAAALIWLLHRAVIGPILSIDGTVRDVAETRDLSIRPRVEGHTEFGRLATSIDSMLEALAQYEAELRRAKHEAESAYVEQGKILSRATFAEGELVEQTE